MTVLAAAMTGVLLVVGVAALWLAGAVFATHRARAAADLAALAAATQVAQHTGTPCTVAATLADANGATLATCAVAADGSVTVTVTVSVAVQVAAPGLPEQTVARARAGPAP